MRKNSFIAIRILLITTLFVSSASAYIGPGAGADGFASLVGGAMGLGLFLVGSVWYPIKLAIGKIKKTLGRS